MPWQSLLDFSVAVASPNDHQGAGSAIPRSDCHGRKRLAMMDRTRKTEYLRIDKKVARDIMDVINKFDNL